MMLEYHRTGPHKVKDFAAFTKLNNAKCVSVEPGSHPVAWLRTHRACWLKYPQERRKSMLIQEIKSNWKTDILGYAQVIPSLKTPNTLLGL